MPVQNIDSTILKRWLENNEACIIDVREPAEHAAEHIEGATLVPLNTISKHNIPDITGRKLVLHCQSGKRSTNACKKLLAEIPDLEIYNLEGGISAWIKNGHDIHKSGTFFLPLDRQVQLAIGFSILLGSLLTYYVHPLFTLLTGFFGAGLILAGTTGYCALAMMMAKMPWNQHTHITTSCSIK